MEPKIISKKSFNVVGLEMQTTTKTLQSDAAQIWDKASSLDLDNEVQRRVDQNLSLAIIRNWSETKPVSYFLGAEVEQIENVPPECVSQIVDDATYAVFDLIGKGANITEPWPEIMEWLVSENYEWILPMNFREYNDATQGVEFSSRFLKFDY